MRVRFVAALVLPCLALVAPRAARAEEESRTVPEAGGTVTDYLVNRSHTIAELEAGIIALPNAPISGGHRGGDTPIGTIGKGDATLQTGVHLLYRGGRDWAIGAGALFGPRPTSDEQYGGASGLNRTHARSYVQLGTEGRYIPLHFRTFEGWVGVTFGGIIVADRFVTNSPEDVPPILGTKEVTIRSEGVALGLQLGVDWLFAERLVAGFTTRVDRWWLPQNPHCSPIGDCATLTGAVQAIEFGLKIGYRLPL